MGSKADLCVACGRYIPKDEQWFEDAIGSFKLVNETEADRSGIIEGPLHYLCLCDTVYGE